jgi:hypothetical protein
MTENSKSTSIKFIVSLSIATSILTSCGPNAEEVAVKEKARMDSVTQVTEEATRKKVAIETLVADSIAADNMTREIEKGSLKQSLSDARTQLRLAKEKLGSIKEFQLGRTKAEKEQQIEDQYKVIQSWEDEISRLGELLGSY